jgi:integrase
VETEQGRLMGRRPRTPNSIPRLRIRDRGGKRYYFYDHGGKPRREESLGSDYGLAVKRWAEIEHETAERPQAVITFRYVANKYRAEVIPTKADRTQRDNAAELANLVEFFDDPPGPLDAIEPMHVKQYLRWRSAAPVRAKREKALLSHLWNWAREQGYTALPNPCAGVKSAAEGGRKVYVEDGAYRAIWTAGDAALRDAMDIAYLTGQRPSDVLKLRETDIRDRVLHIEQGKTGLRVRIEISGELAEVLSRIKARKTGYVIHNTALVVNDHGRPVSLALLQRRWQRARAAAGLPAELQFRDLRAKAGTDKAEASGDARQAQRQLGHTSVVTTERYLRERLGDRVTPTKGRIAEKSADCGKNKPRRKRG